MTKLENEFITVEVDSKGAEIYSLASKQDGTEFIWQADAKYWPWHAPVCFPIVGRLVNNQYHAGDHTYSLTVHGFARDRKFTCVEAAADRVVYRLNYDQSTLEKFPFRFQFDIAYTLRGNGADVEYYVKNLDDHPLYFSLGAHTGFNCPLSPGETFADYELVLEKPETARCHLVENGLLSGRTELLLQDEDRIPLSQDLFRKDVLIFKDLQSRFITLRSRKSGKFVTVHFEGFPYLGIWTKPEGAPFVCIEPWYGLTDSIGDSKQISEKKGILVLPVGQVFRCSYEIVVGQTIQLTD